MIHSKEFILSISNDKWIPHLENTLCPKLSNKTLRLFAVACARECLTSDADPRSVNAVNVAERYALGKATADELEAAWSAAASAASSAAYAASSAAYAAYAARNTTPTWQAFGPGTNSLPTPFLSGYVLTNDGVDAFWSLVDLAAMVTGLLDSDHIDLSDLANNSALS